MTGKELLDKLLKSYESSYDIEQSFNINGDTYDAHAGFNVTSAKYVLVKKAELWRANCFEHAFFKCIGCLEPEDVMRFREEIDTYIEPQLVLGGQKLPGKDHMYTFMTVIFICEDGVMEEARRAVEKFRFVKNYCFSLQGYSEARVLVFDMKEKKVFGNRAARDMVKGYSKADIF